MAETNELNATRAEVVQNQSKQLEGLRSRNVSGIRGTESSAVVDPAATGMVRVTLHEAEVPVLKGITGPSSSYYVMLRLGVRTSYTDTVCDTHHPTFQQSFQFQCSGKFNKTCLQITLMEAGANKCVGSTELPFSGNFSKRWLQLDSKDHEGKRCKIQLSMEFREDTPRRRSNRRKRQPAPMSRHLKNNSQGDKWGSGAVSPRALLAKPKSQWILEIFTVVWIISLVVAVLYTHVQYLTSSKNFFIMDPQDETCLSWNGTKAKFDTCRVFNGPTAVFSAEEGEDERQGLYKILFNTQPSNETALCLGQKKDKMASEPCSLARWEYTGVHFVHDGEYCLHRVKTTVRIHKCDLVPATETLKMVVMYDSGNTYIAKGLESLQKNRVELFELAALRFLQRRWRHLISIFSPKNNVSAEL